MAAPRFATRLNSFAAAARPGGKAGVAEMVALAATVPGLTEVELNYPDHVSAGGAAAGRLVADRGLALGGFAMRYYSNPGFRRGAFTNPDPAVRREAIDLTRRAMDEARAAAAPMLTIWPGQDAVDTPFQADHSRLWADELAAIAEIAAHDPALPVSLEYKPDEPRARAVLPDMATTLLAIAEIGAPNLGVTLDFCHSLYAGERPAAAAAMALRAGRLMGLHLNDGYGRRDDGLMVGSVNLVQTLELLVAVRCGGYSGSYYFDTFPDASGLDPVAECTANIATTTRLLDAAARLADDAGLAAAQAAQDAVAALAAAQRALGLPPG